MELSPALLARLTDRELSQIEYFVVHHTADPDQVKDIAEIAAEEIASQGFSTVGYHAVIWKTGEIQEGRPIGKVPAANLGLNTLSYAVSLEGNFQPGSPGYAGEQPSTAALAALVERIKLVKAKCPSLKYLIGHRDVAAIAVRLEGGTLGDYATACPGDSLYAHLHDLRVATGLSAP
jgi:N-acetylmuramoyl-L-alanine amidase